MRCIYLFCLLFFVAGVGSSLAQSIVFEKYFSDGSFPARMVQTPSGEYLITGIRDVNEPVKYHAYLSKFSETGELIWQLEYRDTTHLILPKDVKVAFDSTYYLLATYATTDYTESKILLLHLDTAGTVLWAKTYAATVDFDAVAMDITKVGDITIAANGGSDITHYQTMNAFVMRLSLTGNMVWNQLFDISSTGDFITDLKVLPDGSFVASCGTYGSSGGALKGSFTGDLEWVKIFHAGTYWSPQSVTSDKSGNIWLAGEVVYPTDLWWINNIAPCVMKLEDDGTPVFFKRIKQPWKATWFEEIIQTWDSQFALSMFFQDNNITSSDAVIVKMDSTGNIHWSKNYESGLFLYYFQDMIETRDSGLAGTTSISFSEYNDYSFFKTDKCGNTCADSSFDFAFSDTTWFAVSAFPTVSSLDLVIDSMPLPKKGVIPDQFTICEDDSFFSPLTAVDNDPLSGGEEVSVFPNPSSDVFHLKSNYSSSQKSEIRLYDTFGNLLLVRKVTGDIVPFGEDLSAGIYVLEFLRAGSRQGFLLIKM